VLPKATALATTGLPGFGAVGDSMTRGYFGRNGYPGNHNWVEQLAALRGLDFGPYGIYPDPQDQTFEHVWAAGTANALGAQTA